MLVIQILVGVAAPILFYQEAKRQGKSPTRWVFIAIGAYWGVYLVLAIVVLPIVITLMGINYMESYGAQVWSGIIAFVSSFVALVTVRKKLIPDPPEPKF